MNRFLFVLYIVAASALVNAQPITTVFIPTCNGTNDTAALQSIITRAGGNPRTIQLPYKADAAQRCKLTTITIPANITLDNTNGSGIARDAPNVVTVLGPVVNPVGKTLFFGTGTTSYAGNSFVGVSGEPAPVRLTVHAVPDFNLAGGSLGAGVVLPFTAPVIVQSGKAYDHIRISKNSGDYNVFDNAGLVSGLDFQLQASALSTPSSALYGIIGQLNNLGPGSTKAIYGRTTMGAGSTGFGMAGVFAVTAGTADPSSITWVHQWTASDNVDAIAMIHADDTVSANVSDGIVFATNMRIEAGGAFLKAFQTTGHDGDFLKYSTQLGATLFRVDKDGIIRLPNNTYITGRNAANTDDRDMIKINTSNELEIGRGITRFNAENPAISLGDSATGWSLQKLDADSRFRILKGSVGDMFQIDASGNATVLIGDMGVRTQGKGLILRATDGALCYLVTVNNAGVLAQTSTPCP